MGEMHDEGTKTGRQGDKVTVVKSQIPNPKPQTPRQEGTRDLTGRMQTPVGKPVRSGGKAGAGMHWAVTAIGLALAVLPAALPYFGDGLPRTNDALTHLYRTLPLERVIRDGRLWPRWAPDLVHGYGYPVFNFFPSLSHYVVFLLHFAGLALTNAYRVAGLAYFVLAAWFAYLMARDLFGPAGGWVTALAYVYSPYLLYDAHVRGSLPECQALALIPLLFLALRRATVHGGRWLAATALVFAAAFLSHHGIVFQTLIPIGILLLWLAWQEGWRHLWRPLTGLALGVLLTAFFWLPALAEVQYVRSGIIASQGFGHLSNFVTLRDLLRWPRLPADPALVNPPVVHALPQVTLAIALVVVPWRWQSLSQAVRRQVGLWLVVLVVCTALIMPFSQIVWDTVPLLKLTYLPWRLLGPASLAAATLAGAAFAGAMTDGRTLVRLALATLLLAIGGVPWLYPPREPVPEAPTMADVLAFEQPPLFIGTTTLGEFLPRWVEELPDTADRRRSGELRNALAAGGSPDRLVAPEGVTLTVRPASQLTSDARSTSASPLDATYHIHTDNPVTLTYRQFYFPGWRATLDGEPLACRPSHPEGLLLFDVPAGTHVLRVTFGSTWPRTLGWALSGLGALALVSITAPDPKGFGKPLGSSADARSTGRPPGPLARALPWAWTLTLTGLALGVWLFFATVDTPLRRDMLSPDGLRGVQHTQAVDFAGELRLLGYEQSVEHMRADDEVTLTLYWRPLHPIGVTYDVAVHVVDENGLAWSAGDAVRPPDWRFVPGTDRWPLDGYVMDPSVLRLADGTPPGEYTFHVGLVRHDTHQTVAEHQVSRLVVTQPYRGDRPLEAGMEPAPEAYTWGGLRLLGSRTDRREAAPGDPVRVTLLWQVIDPNNAGCPGQVTLRLATGDGETILTSTVPIARDYPPIRWQQGDRLRTEILLCLPARAPAGEHSWEVRLDADVARASEGEQTAYRTIAALDVRVPERLWSAPPLEVQTNASLGGVASLLGANIQPASLQVESPADITVTLAWQAEAETATSYRVFLHLVGPDGKLATQSDGEPANWTRPTTGWLPEEIVMDERVLHVPAGAPAGEYTLLCGLYDLATGERLIASDGSDAVLLATLALGTP
jgi:hypothetical protein